jgi:hypothetical protein
VGFDHRRDESVANAHHIEAAGLSYRSPCSEDLHRSAVDVRDEEAQRPPGAIRERTRGRKGHVTLMNDAASQAEALRPPAPPDDRASRARRAGVADTSATNVHTGNGRGFEDERIRAVGVDDDTAWEYERDWMP